MAPNSRIIAGPLRAEEGILYADCNLEIGINMKIRHDFAVHYNRSDIFQLQVNRGTPHLYTVVGIEERPELAPPRTQLTPGEHRATLARPQKQLAAPTQVT